MTNTDPGMTDPTNTIAFQGEAGANSDMACRAAFPGEPTELLLGKAMFEILRPGISKGESIRKLVAHVPFSGRMPVSVTRMTTSALSPPCGSPCRSNLIASVMPGCNMKSLSELRFGGSTTSTPTPCPTPRRPLA